MKRKKMRNELFSSSSPRLTLNVVTFMGLMTNGGWLRMFPEIYYYLIQPSRTTVITRCLQCFGPTECQGIESYQIFHFKKRFVPWLRNTADISSRHQCLSNILTKYEGQISIILRIVHTTRTGTGL
jgi:hypothetical protein